MNPKRSWRIASLPEFVCKPREMIPEATFTLKSELSTDNPQIPQPETAKQIYSSQNLQQPVFKTLVADSTCCTTFCNFLRTPCLKLFKHTGFETVVTPALVASCGELAVRVLQCMSDKLSPILTPRNYSLAFPQQLLKMISATLVAISANFNSDWTSNMVSEIQQK